MVRNKLLKIHFVVSYLTIDFLSYVYKKEEQNVPLLIEVYVPGDSTTTMAESNYPSKSI
ncbi:MAG: hypothetical protein ABI581_00125 [Sediminibacterium sp.]